MKEISITGRTRGKQNAHSKVSLFIGWPQRDMIDIYTEM